MIPSYYGTKTLSNGNNPVKLRNILTNYGTITLEDLTKYKYNYVGQNIRRYKYGQALFE